MEEEQQNKLKIQEKSALSSKMNQFIMENINEFLKMERLVFDLENF